MYNNASNTWVAHGNLSNPPDDHLVAASNDLTLGSCSLGPVLTCPCFVPQRCVVSGCPMLSASCCHSNAFLCCLQAGVPHDMNLTGFAIHYDENCIQSLYLYSMIVYLYSHPLDTFSVTMCQGITKARTGEIITAHM